LDFQRWRWWLDGWMDHPIAIVIWETTVLHRKGQLQVEFIGIEHTFFCYPATG
jgi:hypothetical protein